MLAHHIQNRQISFLSPENITKLLVVSDRKREYVQKSSTASSSRRMLKLYSPLSRHQTISSCLLRIGVLCPAGLGVEVLVPVLSLACIVTNSRLDTISCCMSTTPCTSCATLFPYHQEPMPLPPLIHLNPIPHPPSTSQIPHHQHNPLRLVLTYLSIAHCIVSYPINIGTAQYRI